ncbi:MAG: hypothetical protein A4S14_08810 [Proteobacteria bacterium SG_bin9]|nr:MAG: hypothetical protein A4S14_08810 [Proteobacteria bacterium SG_bin9]
MLGLALAHALALQAVLPSWARLLQTGPEGLTVLCRVVPTAQKTTGGDEPPPHHDCLASCLAALTGAAVAAREAATEPRRGFIIVSQSHRASDPKREHLSTAWSARGPPSAA